ncbi:MAG: phenylacetate-CoA oxygenase subunit PaaJ [Phycisphaerae bacterium]|nr:phenylacetate-CoA oxygenase subunit PaaJ [Phycisphaerae bacterium]
MVTDPRVPRPRSRYDAPMITTAQVERALATIPDPEMPISITELGIIDGIDLEPTASGAAIVRIALLPTFVGCPALDMIERQIVEKVTRLDGVERVEVRVIYDPPWTVDRISESGRASLREHGVTVPSPGDAPAGGSTLVKLRTSAVPCPFCGSTEIHLDSAFGPTRCRSIHYCDACRNTFEHLKRV